MGVFRGLWDGGVHPFAQVALTHLCPRYGPLLCPGKVTKPFRFSVQPAKVALCGAQEISVRHAPKPKPKSYPGNRGGFLALVNKPQVDMNKAAIIGPMTNPFSPNTAIPPNVDIRIR